MHKKHTLTNDQMSTNLCINIDSSGAALMAAGRWPPPWDGWRAVTLSSSGTNGRSTKLKSTAEWHMDTSSELMLRSQREAGLLLMML